MGDESQLQVPPTLKGLFKAAMYDRIPSTTAVDWGSGFSPGGKEAIGAIEHIIRSDPQLTSRFFDSHDWCIDDDDKALASYMDTQRYIDYAVRRQQALGKQNLSDEDFEARWQEILDFAQRETLDWRFRAPLKNFALRDGRLVDIGEQFRIRALADDELQGDGEREGAFSFELPPRFAIEASLTGEPRRIQLAPAAGLPPIMLILAVLRLFRAKGVWLASVTAESNSPLDEEGLTWTPFEWTGHPIDPHFADRAQIYLLERRDSSTFFEALRKVWHAYHEQSNVKRSIDLYNGAFEQSTVESSLLRVWGAIESAFVPSGSRRIAETAATNLSELLRPVGTARNEIKRKLRDSYRHRSELVHGSSAVAGLDLLTICSFTTRCYRDAIAILLGFPVASDHDET